MECRLDKKGKSGIGGWSSRCYRLRGCELLQYKRGIDSFQECTDKTIKQRFHIYQLQNISVGARTPYVLRFDYTTKYGNETLSVQLKFNDVSKQKKKGVDHLLFTAWFRIVCASSKLAYNPQCQQRPLPTPFCFALYYLLQKLYLHRDVLSTAGIFSSSSSSSSITPQVSKLYYNLLVNHKKFYMQLKQRQQLDDDIHLLANTLLFTLQNTPTSLFCDSHCRALTEFVMEILNKAKQKAASHANEQHVQNRAYQDEELALLQDRKEYAHQIRNWFLQRYSSKKTEFKSKNDFNLFHRYGFLTILMLLLCNISSAQHHQKTQMSAHKLAQIFARPLQSKKYLYDCHTDEIRKVLNANKSNGKGTGGVVQSRKDEQYERDFVKTLKILIYCAKDIFPGLDTVPWKLTALLRAQGQERRMVKHYNDAFSKDTVNEYYIPPVLPKNIKDHGNFDGNYYGKQEEKEQHSSSDEEEHEEAVANTIATKKMNAYKMAINGQPIASVERAYGVQRQTSYAEQPAYTSDIGISSMDEDAFSDDDNIHTYGQQQQRAEEEEEEKYPDEYAQKKQEMQRLAMVPARRKHKRPPPAKSDLGYDSTDYDADIGGTTDQYNGQIQRTEEMQSITQEIGQHLLGVVDDEMRRTAPSDIDNLTSGDEELYEPQPLQPNQVTPYEERKEQNDDGNAQRMLMSVPAEIQYEEAERARVEDSGYVEDDELKQELVQDYKRERDVKMRQQRQEDVQQGEYDIHGRRVVPFDVQLLKEEIYNNELEQNEAFCLADLCKCVALRKLFGVEAETEAVYDDQVGDGYQAQTQEEQQAVTVERMPHYELEPRFESHLDSSYQSQQRYEARQMYQASQEELSEMQYAGPAQRGYAQ